MPNLIDTHALLWFLNGDTLLSKKAKARIEDPSEMNVVSVASLWEIAIKVSVGKLAIHHPFEELPVLIKKNGFQLLPITFNDTLTVSTLPLLHRDPFDRILIAHAINQNLTVITADQQFLTYDIDWIW